jgi:septal ring factor EnvC (AmiA/AmiB activator)
MTAGRRLCIAASLLLLAASRLHAQDQSSRLRAQQDTLARLRREREQLERRAADLQTSVHDLSEEVSNLKGRADATSKIVHALDSQLEMINGEVADATRDVSITQRDLAQKKVALHDRLVDIYKRGPLFTTQVLLSARSFGELVARYKYLHLLALHDRALVRRVDQLHQQVRKDQDRLVSLQSAVEQNRDDKAREEAQLRELEQDRGANLARTQREVQLTEARLAKLRATESQLTNAITLFDTERRRAEAARPTVARTGSSIKTSDYGRLDWPVDGPLVYTFGKAQTASNTTIRWNGVGIKANVGTAVMAVAQGRVVSAAPLGTYGLTVIIDHGGGDYSIYGSLSRADVRQGQQVTKGQQIGGVGISDPEYPPHLHFEIRHGGPDGRPASVDPATWLREQR